ncbi:N-acetylglucosamine-6-phosphate deacetylase [Halobacillus litoralis]|uniref:N-acetylglucosamine-6-phosphate deacetylase n=1 Tax=Halobacillus litoralis TaxID=45668 RepID=UPI0024913E5F|nr:N-acetylglucosamine-6-phosphate deacetylase [Halobacillus litoralis]
MEEILEITNVQIIAESETIPSGTVQIKDGKIHAILQAPSKQAAELIDGKGMTLVPGFIDVHIHGANGYDVMDATTEALDGMAAKLPEEGTTSFLATTMTQSVESISVAVKNIGDYMDKQKQPGKAEVLGVHLEGPFISKEKAGAQPHGHILLPSVQQFDEWQQESGNQIRLVTAAPEVEGGYGFFSHLSDQGVTASIGHSAATFDEANRAVDHGASHVTHLFNQMSGFHHREPGIVGAAFNNKKLKVEMIVDHIHVHQKAVETAYQLIGSERTVLITDAMRAKCLPEGTYDLGGQPVVVQGKEARLSDGTLAGSILRLDEAAYNMKTAMGLDWQEFVRITSTNAAEQTGFLDRKGTIATGKDADLVLLDEKAQVMMTICSGTIAFDGRN